MKENTHVIWSDINLNLDDWRNDLKQTYPNADDNFLYKAMYENNASYLYDERINLDIQLPREIIVIADLGLWNGRHSGYKVIESGNIRDCLYSDGDFEPTLQGLHVVLAMKSARFMVGNFPKNKNKKFLKDNKKCGIMKA